MKTYFTLFIIGGPLLSLKNLLASFVVPLTLLGNQAYATCDGFEQGSMNATLRGVEAAYALESCSDPGRNFIYLTDWITRHWADGTMAPVLRVHEYHCFYGLTGYIQEHQGDVTCGASLAGFGGGGSGSGGSGGGSMGNGRMCHGSIIVVDNQVIGESIAISGAPFEMLYFSDRIPGRSGAYTAYTPITTDTRTGVTGINFELKDSLGNTVSTASYSNIANQTNAFVWNGLDASSNETWGPALFKVKVTENYATGSYPIESTVMLGGLKINKLGLGGWYPSLFSFYDAANKNLYQGNGRQRYVQASSWGSGGYYIAEEDASSVSYYDSVGRIVEIKTGLTGTTIYTFSYDTAGRLLSIAEPFSRVTTFDRDLSGNLVSITAPNGKVTGVTLNTNGYIASMTNPSSETYSMTYNTGGLLQTFTKPAGQVSSFSYDINGNLTQDTHSGGYFSELIREIAVSSQSSVSLVTPMSRVTTSEISEGLIGVDNWRVNSKMTFPDGTYELNNYQVVPSSNFAYRTSNLRNGVNTNQNFMNDLRFGTLARFMTSDYLYNGSVGRSVTRTQNVVLSAPTDPFSISSYSIVESNTTSSSSTTHTYNPSTLTWTSASTLGNTSLTKIDTYERVVQAKVGNLTAVDFTYTDENLTKIAQGSREHNLSYNSAGLLSAISNPLSESTEFTYDSTGRLYSKIFPDSRYVIYSYDANGNLSGITPPGKTIHTFNMNSSELPSAYVPPTLSGVTNVTTTYSYNSDKQLTQIERPTGDTIDYNYNATTGALTSFTTAVGTYNTTIIPDGGVQYLSEPSGNYLTRNHQGILLASEDYYGPSGLFYTYTRTFGANGLKSSDAVVRGASSSTINYLYNIEDKLSKAGDVTLIYNTPNAQLTGTSMGSGTSQMTDTYTYNTFGEVTGYIAKRGTTTLYSYTVTRDALGRVSNKSETIGGTTVAYDVDYDISGRIIETSNGGTVLSSYGYDSNSNRDSGVIGGTTTTATYDAQDRLMTYNVYDFGYNANGDLLSKTNTLTSVANTYTFDVFGHLTGAVTPTKNIVYGIDGLGRRVSKKVGSTVTERYVYMDDLRLAATANSAGTLAKRFVYGSKANVPDYMIIGSVKYRIISDNLGSVRLVVKVSDGTISQRLDYDVFGKVTADTNPGFQPFGFAGGMYDPDTKLVHFGAREYDAEVGRWTSKDPILFGGGDTNLFGYVANDPVNFIDPIGLWSFSASLFTGAGGSLTFGADNSSGRPFLTMRFGYGLGAGASFDEKGSSPVSQCSRGGPNASLGVYGDASVNNGPHEFGISGGGGFSSKKGSPYYLNANPTNTLGTSMGIGGGASVGVELSFF